MARREAAMRDSRILSWNVNGIRAALRKGFLEWLRRESPDILCIQETKAWPDQLDEQQRDPEGYHSYWDYTTEAKGYSGVATFTKVEPVDARRGFGVGRFDTEARVVVTEYTDFTLFNVYFPNGKKNAERLQYKLAFYDAFLEPIDNLRAQGKKLIICGDYNTAHKEIDIARPKENEKVSGFLPIEREWMDKLVSHGFVDTFRHFHDEPDQYTWWDLKTRARERNVGWRIDYFFVSDNLLPAVKDAFIMPDVMGSDHCPIGIVVETGQAERL
jgi:exodeoxyribonuclease-3